MTENLQGDQVRLSDVKPSWGKHDNDNFGYATEEERLERRGLEDWEIVEELQESQPTTPYWFIAVVVIVLLVAVGLSFPFWGLRPGVTVNWVDWVTDPGFLGGIAYVTIGGLFVRYMTNLYGTSSGGSTDQDAEEKNDNGGGDQK